MGRDEGLGVGYAPALADGFLVHIVRSGHEFTVIVAGELDRCASSAMEQRVHQFVEPDVTLVIDLQDVSFLDSTGLQALWGLRRRQLDGGGRFLLKSPSLSVERVLRTTQLITVFEIVPPSVPRTEAVWSAAGSAAARAKRRA